VVFDVCNRGRVAAAAVAAVVAVTSGAGGEAVTAARGGCKLRLGSISVAVAVAGRGGGAAHNGGNEGGERDTKGRGDETNGGDVTEAGKRPSAVTRGVPRSLRGTQGGCGCGESSALKGGSVGASVLPSSSVASRSRSNRAFPTAATLGAPSGAAVGGGVVRGDCVVSSVERIGRGLAVGCTGKKRGVGKGCQCDQGSSHHEIKRFWLTWPRDLSLARARTAHYH